MKKNEIDRILKKAEADIKSGKRNPAKEGMTLDEFKKEQKEKWGFIK